MTVRLNEHNRGELKKFARFRVIERLTKLCPQCDIDDKIEDEAYDLGVKFKNDNEKENYIKEMREFYDKR